MWTSSVDRPSVLPICSTAGLAMSTPCFAPCWITGPAAEETAPPLPQATSVSSARAVLDDRTADRNPAFVLIACSPSCCRGATAGRGLRRVLCSKPSPARHPGGSVASWVVGLWRESSNMIDWCVVGVVTPRERGTGIGASGSGLAGRGLRVEEQPGEQHVDRSNQDVVP